MRKHPGKFRSWAIRKLGGFVYEPPTEPRITRYTMPVEKFCCVVRLSGFDAAHIHEEWMKKVIQERIICEISSELVRRGIVKITERNTDIGVQVMGTLIVGAPEEEDDI